MLRLCLYLAAGLLAVACSSAPSKAPPPDTSQALRISWIDHRSGSVLELVNTAHTDRLEQYSKTRENAGRKVLSNEVMAALADYLRQNGFSELSQPGPAPATPDAKSSWSLEIEQAGDERHIDYLTGLAPDARQRYRALWQAFLDTYNSTYGLQSVQLKKGETPFANPEPPKKKN